MDGKMGRRCEKWKEASLYQMTQKFNGEFSESNKKIKLS